MRLLSRIIRAIFPAKANREDALKSAIDETVKQRQRDPLELFARSQADGGWPGEKPSAIQRDVDSFPLVESYTRPNVAMDAAIKAAKVMDSYEGDDASPSAKFANRSSGLPEQLQDWYVSQSFIGYQSCAIIAQHWLVDKACSMIGEDAVRNGWEIKAMGDDKSLSKQDLDRLREFDTAFKLKANLAEFDRNKNIFGIRVAIFHVESTDPDYYEKPFNIDGVTEGSYKGISQVDPYWMMPMLTAESTADPANINFYNPEFWVISGKKYHRSHLIIATGPQPADVLKPTYIFGGIPLTQRIYERVYAAERTANEAPLLSLSKRTTALHTNVEKALLNEKSFLQKLILWTKYRDNYAVKVLGTEETMEQFDTSLTDFDSIIMNQYQLVSAIAKTPATKLLGTSPKGFNATGEFELVAYHQELESVQEHTQMPLLQRHYDILAKSLCIPCKVVANFNPVDSVTAVQQSAINLEKSNTRKNYIDMGAVSPDEVRDTLRDENDSGFNRLTDDAAETEPGMSPEALADFEKAGQSANEGSSRRVPVVPDEGAGSVDLDTIKRPEVTTNPPRSRPDDAPIMSALSTLLLKVQQLEGLMTPEGKDLPNGSSYANVRTTKPSVTGIAPSVAGVGSLIESESRIRYPKIKIGGNLLSIENPRGTVRRGMTIDGAEWETKMPHHYGFIHGVIGADGDELDCFVGPNLQSEFVFVVNQNEPSTGKFDEHKVMFGFDSPEASKEAYESAYQQGWQGFASGVWMDMEDFNDRLRNFKWDVPAEEYYTPKA